MDNCQRLRTTLTVKGQRTTVNGYGQHLQSRDNGLGQRQRTGTTKKVTMYSRQQSTLNVNVQGPGYNVNSNINVDID